MPLPTIESLQSCKEFLDQYRVDKSSKDKVYNVNGLNKQCGGWGRGCFHIPEDQ